MVVCSTYVTIIICLSMCIVLLSGDVQAADPLGPGKGPWLKERPESHGLDPKELSQAREAVFKIKGRDCFVVIKDGALVYESYGGLFESSETAHQGYSMTKTIGALIVGRAEAEGKLDIDADITASYGIDSPRPYPVTARQIMSQAIAGSHGPGQQWKYDAVGTNWVLTRIVKKAAGEKSSSIWQRAFHTPLGLAKSFEFTFPGIDEVFAFSSKGTCRDFARIGQLILNRGRWAGYNGTIVDEAYVDAMTTPQTRYGSYPEYANPMYGLLTWLNPHMNETGKYPGVSKLPPNNPIAPDQEFPQQFPIDAAFLGGAFGQNVMILPSDRMVAVSMGTSESDIAGARIAQTLASALCPVISNCRT
eukprot:g3004.t1